MLTSRMTNWQALLDRLLSAAMLILAVITLSGAMLMLLGSRVSHPLFGWIGEWLAVPGLLVSILPILATVTLLSIWVARSVYSHFGENLYQDSRTLANVASKPALRVGLTDDEIALAG